MRKQISHSLTLFLVLMTCMFGSFAAEAQTVTAKQAIDKAAAKMKSIKGLSASFSMSTGGKTVKGTLASSGSKFALLSPQMSTWYDGKTMWTYNGHTKETTITNPTHQELAESNPLMLVSLGSSQFTASYAKNQAQGTLTVVLAPKTRSTGMKSVHVTLNKTTMLPVKLVAVPSSGSTITISISGVKTGVTHASSVFVYSQKKYPKATLVDLR